MKKTKFLVRIGTISSCIDMMRYDQCFPASDEDSRKLEKAQMGGGKRTYMDHLVKFIGVSPSCPTRERWASFGCTVMAVGETATNKTYEMLERSQVEQAKEKRKR